MAKKIRRQVPQGRPRKPPPPPKAAAALAARAKAQPLPRPGDVPPSVAASKPAQAPSQPQTITQALRTTTRDQQKLAMKWFTDMIKGEMNARGQAKSSRRRIAADAFTQKTGLPKIGQMYFYLYDAKWKDDLPYWDKFPLVIPIKYYDNGWLGVNLHYLPPMLRGQLLDKLMEYAKAYPTERAFMKVSYDLLKNIDKSKHYKPTIHRYLKSQLQSGLVKVEAEYWEKAARLPVQQFASTKGGITSAQVWADSKRIMRK